MLGRRFLPPFTQGPIRTFGPFYEGTYDALIIDFRKRFSRRFALGASYTFADATDNSLGIESLPSDSFIGTVPPVTEPSTGRSNANGSFTRANGTLVQQAGTFLNGPDRDKGPSGLSLDHVLQVSGLVELPYQILVSGIFRAQSGFHFSRNPAAGVLVDPDGDASVNGIDVDAGRNAFTAPSLFNLDMRFTKRFDITNRIKADVLVEFFNMLNRQNPAAVGTPERCRNSSHSASRYRSCPDERGRSVSESSSSQAGCQRHELPTRASGAPRNRAAAQGPVRNELRARHRAAHSARQGVRTEAG